VAYNENSDKNFGSFSVMFQYVVVKVFSIPSFRLGLQMKADVKGNG
jgi:hypothetical protein